MRTATAGFSGFEQPVDRLGGDLGQDACDAVPGMPLTSQECLPRALLCQRRLDRGERVQPRGGEQRAVQVALRDEQLDLGAAGDDALRAAARGVVAMTPRYSARDSAEMTPQTSSR